METYFDSRLDLLQRRLSKQSERLKIRAEETLNEMFKKDLFKRRPSSSTSQQFERDMQKFKVKVVQSSTASVRSNLNDGTRFHHV